MLMTRQNLSRCHSVPTQISNRLKWDRTQNCWMTGWRITTWATTGSQTSFPVSIVTNSVALQTDRFRIHYFYLLVFVTTTGALLTQCYRLYHFSTDPLLQALLCLCVFVTTTGALLTHCYRFYHFSTEPLLQALSFLYWPTATGFIISIYVFLLPQLGHYRPTFTGFIISICFCYHNWGTTDSLLQALSFLYWPTVTGFIISMCFCYHNWGTTDPLLQGLSFLFVFVTTNGALQTHFYRVYHFYLFLLPQLGHY